MSKTKYDRLQELDHSKFEIVKGDPDIRGWDVRYTNGEKIGSIEELIFDTKAKKVRYMIVDLEENELRLEHRKVLIPIGFAELDSKNDDVLIPNVSIDQLCSLPQYKRNSLSPELERNISSIFGRKVNIEPVKTLRDEQRVVKDEAVMDHDVEPDFYSHDHYNTNNLYKNRQHEAKQQIASDPELDKGLRMWEKRNESEIIDTSDLSEIEREKLFRYRRELYRQRRYKKESV